MAAAQAVEAIARNVRQWNPSSSPSPSPSCSPPLEEGVVKTEDMDTGTTSTAEIELLSFEKFDIMQVTIVYISQ